MEGVDRAFAEQKPAGASAISWSVAHVTNQLDGWVNSRFAGLPVHDVIGSRRYRNGDGRAEDWPGIQRGVAEVRVRARAYLDHLSEDDLRRTTPYDGSLIELRPGGLNLGYALLRIAAHHYVHIGEMAGYLGSRGHEVPSLPGRLPEVMAVLQNVPHEGGVPSLITGADHVQLAIPAGGEENARRFYGGLLGLREVVKPAVLAERGGCWFVGPELDIHLGVEEAFVPWRKAHVALLVRDLDGARAAFMNAGARVVEDDAGLAVRRFYVADPFGNLLEIVDERDRGFTRSDTRV